MTGLLSKVDDFLASLSARFWIWASILIFFVVFGLMNHLYIMGWPSPNINLSIYDPDVYIRLTKVRELIQGGSFYNHEVIATNAPYGGISTPWTRPLDFILLTLYQFTPTDLSIEKRLLVVANWYPIIIFPLIILFLTKAAETGLRSTKKFFIIGICLIGHMIFTEFDYFLPGNADHHTLMALLWCICIWLILDKPSNRSAIGLGLAMGLWLWVSPEAVPFIIVSLAILGAQAILKPHLSYYPILTSGVLTIVITLALFIEHPIDFILSNTSIDTISIVYTTLFSLCTLGFVILHQFISPLENIRNRAIFTGATAFSFCALFLMIFPKFIKGPMADVDPYIITHFLPRISEARPIFTFDPSLIIGGQFLTVPALLLCLRFMRRSPQTLTLFILPFCMVLFQTRWYYYLEGISIIAIAKFLPTYARALSLKYRKISFLLHPYMLLVILYGAIYCILALIPASKNAEYAYTDKCQYAGFQIVQSGQLVKALGPSPITFETNILGNSGISFFTPYRYIAGYYHREGVGLQTKDKILDAPTLESIRPLLKERNVKALLVCQTPNKTWINEYFETIPPKKDWVKINPHIHRPEKTDLKEYPILLNISP